MIVRPSEYDSWPAGITEATLTKTGPRRYTVEVDGQERGAVMSYDGSWWGVIPPGHITTDGGFCYVSRSYAVGVLLSEG